MEEVKKGRCDTCGFLALRFFNDSDLHEASQEYREHGADTDGTALSRGPLCIVQAVRLDLEVATQNNTMFGQGMGLRPESVMAVIQKDDRQCPEWRKWVLGFSPKEHREMMDREWLLEREDRRDHEQREFQEQQEDKADKRHTEQMEQLKGLHKMEMWIVGGIVGIIIVASTIVGAGIEADWIPKWFGLRN